MIATLIILSLALCGSIVFIIARLRSWGASAAEIAVLRQKLEAALADCRRSEAALADCRLQADSLEDSMRSLSEKHIRLQAQADNLSLTLDTERRRFTESSELADKRHLAALADEKQRHSLELAALEQRHTREMASAEARQKELLQQTEARFKVMASEIMRDQSAALTDHNSQHLASLLTPLKDDIEKFRNDVNQAYSSEARERFSLQERIKELIEANNSIGREAKELATALRGNSKTQGDWGELVLETILENSGLRRGSEFTIQQTTDSSGSTLRDEQGRGLRPDVVVHYPDGRAIIIDSKVSLTAFIDYVNTDDPQRRDHFGRLHLASVVKHINELADKNYQDHVGTRRLDFVMMFIPNESAYAAAMTLDPTLWTKAYDKRVLIVSPTQLVGSLRLINQLWSHDRQTRNAIEIAEKSGQMYDKFCGFVADMERIDKALTTTRAAYDSAIAKLRTGRGNLITRAETLRTLGVKASKRLKADMADSDEDASEE